MITTGKYWIISGPGMPTTENTWTAVNDKTSKQENLSINDKFNIPELRVGTLDTLMSLSDDLVKFDNFVEQTTRRIGSQLHVLLGHSSNEQLTVGGADVDTYIRKFKWNEAKYPRKQSCREITENIQKQVAKIDEEIRLKMADYASVVQQVAAAERKKLGTLLVKDLSDIINPADVTDSEYLVSVFVVVNKFNYKDWEDNYERMATYVVPRSGKLVHEEADMGLFSVLMFKRCVDDFKNSAREKRFTVREYTKAGGEENGQDAVKKLTEAKERLRNQLLIWCKTNFEEVFVAWAHLKAVRIHVESILRYGLPANFQSIIMLPTKKQSEPKLRAALGSLFAHLGSNFMDDGKKDEEIGTGEKFYPYVYLEMDCCFH